MVAILPVDCFQTPVCNDGKGDICYKDKDSKRSCDGYLANDYNHSPKVLNWITEGNTNVLIIKVCHYQDICYYLRIILQVMQAIWFTGSSYFRRC